jgi:hypothetical protein
VVLQKNFLKIDKPSMNLTKRRGKGPKLIKLEMKKGIAQQIPMKSKGSLGNTSKIYININWKNLEVMFKLLDWI